MQGAIGTARGSAEIWKPPVARQLAIRHQPRHHLDCGFAQYLSRLIASLAFVDNKHRPRSEEVEDWFKHQPYNQASRMCHL